MAVAIQELSCIGRRFVPGADFWQLLQRAIPAAQDNIEVLLPMAESHNIFLHGPTCENPKLSFP